MVIIALKDHQTLVLPTSLVLLGMLVLQIHHRLSLVLKVLTITKHTQRNVIDAQLGFIV